MKRRLTSIVGGAGRGQSDALIIMGERSEGGGRWKNFASAATLRKLVPLPCLDKIIKLVPLPLVPLQVQNFHGGERKRRREKFMTFPRRSSFYFLFLDRHPTIERIYILSKRRRAPKGGEKFRLFVYEDGF